MIQSDITVSENPGSYCQATRVKQQNDFFDEITVWRSGPFGEFSIKMITPEEINE